MHRGILLVGMAWSALGCGYSHEEAEAECRGRMDGVCLDETNVDECIACYEECGDACATLESCPLQFSCN